jgi:glycosyltransferase involved in cell wall biosynthesis
LIQEYQKIEAVIIVDDGEERLDLGNLPFPVMYYNVERMSIGAKRNFLISRAVTKYCAFFDTDDFYHSQKISDSIRVLVETGKKLTGSSNMDIYSGGLVYSQACVYLDFLNEATLVFETFYGYHHYFADTMSGEGVGFCSTRHIIESPLNMLCIAHPNNTVDKSAWLKNPGDQKLLDPYLDHFQYLPVFKK